MNPEFYDYVMEKLFAVGVYDVFFTPIQMKKNRPGVKLTVLYRKNEEKIIDIILKETSSLGVRIYRNISRVCLQREYRQVETPWGEVRVKLGIKDDKIINIAPEYDQCKKLAEENEVSLKEIYRSARLAI